MTLQLFDTHCHIHEIDGSTGGVHEKWHSDSEARTGDTVLAAAQQAGISRLIVIGTTLADSELAVNYAQAHEGVWASIGIHPHEAKDHRTDEVRRQFTQLASQPKVVAIGECGLDYFYNHSPKADQIEVLRFQIETALAHELPLSFHVREAFDDFWPIYENYQNVRGVLHSFTDDLVSMERGLKHGLYIGTNGIATFTHNEAQLEVYRTIPQRSLLLETDAPFLTPKPFRGKVCEPKHVVLTAEFLSELRGESLSDLANFTTANARQLFKI